MIERHKLSERVRICRIILGFSIIMSGCQGGGGSQSQTAGTLQNSTSDSGGTVAGALDLSGINIVSVQPGGAGSVHVWHSASHSFSSGSPEFSLNPTWTISDANHSVTFGNLDGDSDREIIVVGYCRYDDSNVGIFVNAYEEGEYEYTDGISDVWWTTYYSGEKWLRESSDNYWSNEIFTADLDNNGDSEIVLISQTQIAIFDYEPGITDDRWKGDGTIKLIAKKYISDLAGFDSVPDWWATSVDAGNITGDSKYPDIVLTVNHLDENDEWQGYLMVFSDPGLNNLENFKYYQAEPGSELIHDGLQVCDADGDGSSSIWTLGATHSTGDLLSSHLSHWKWVGDVEPHLEEHIDLPVEVDVTTPSSTIAIGDLLGDHLGDEIAVTSGNHREIKIFNPSPVTDGYSLGDPLNIPVSSDVRINSMTIHGNKIFVGGAMQEYSSQDDSSLYLGVIGRIDEPASDTEFEYEWELRNGPGKEAWDIAVVP